MIVIYGTPTCSFCLRAKKLAARYDLEHEYKDITYKRNRDEMTTKLGHEAKTVPQIFWYGKYIGGYNELALEIENTRNYGDGNLG
jgi:glutaredoxin|tara:strand:- start:1133 stop:1387 length:255 start_codon:yes stop_codon:yes gene_type:complete